MYLPFIDIDYYCELLVLDDTAKLDRFRQLIYDISQENKEDLRYLLNDFLLVFIAGLERFMPDRPKKLTDRKPEVFDIRKI